jgi:murein DD-endopeptidase MepM/ murein hydrolase activator NlpD
MYDYKFRQDQVTFGRPRRRGRRLAVIVAGLVIIGVLASALVRFDSEEGGATEAGDDNVIPLPLPPRSDAQQGPTHRPSRPRLRRPNPDRRGTSEIAASRPVGGRRGSAAAAAGKAAPAVHRAGPTDGFWVEHQVEPGDSLAKIFSRYDLSHQLLQSVLHGSEERGRLQRIRPGDKVRIRFDRDRRFSELSLQLDALRSIRVTATEDGISGSVVSKQAERRVTVASGTIEHTLFASARKSGIDDAVTVKMAKIFGWDIDFALEIRAGDRFSVVYESLWADGEAVAGGDLLAAEFVNQGRTYRAFRHQGRDGKVDYYAADGRPLRKLFFRTPVDFTRISSGFSKRRWHPVLKRWRAHKGVDYAAPVGTPVMATGDGTVAFRGWKRGYGRVVELRHGRSYQTLYGHLSAYARRLKPGDRVEQGDVIGFVGQSGLATGPHLHYEFRIDGRQRNPLTVKAAVADPLTASELRRFEAAIQPLTAMLAGGAEGVMLAETE